jgi:hypothetical protein
VSKGDVIRKMIHRSELPDAIAKALREEVQG